MNLRKNFSCKLLCIYDCFAYYDLSRPIITSTIWLFSKRYFLGVAELYVGGLATGIRDLRVLFDSGTTFSFFAPEAYGALVSMVREIILDLIIR